MEGEFMMKVIFKNQTFSKDIALFTRCLKKRMQTLNLFDFAVEKIGLICFGAFLATFFSKTIKKLRGIFFIAMMVSWVYFIWKIFFLDDKV